MGKNSPKTLTYEIPLTDGHGTRTVKVAASSKEAALQSLPYNPHVSVGQPICTGWQSVQTSIDVSEAPLFTVGTENGSFHVEQGHPSYGHLINTQPKAVKAVNQFLEETSPSTPDEPF